MKKKTHSFYSIYLNILSILLCIFSMILSNKSNDQNMFFVSVILLILVSIEFISNIIHFIKIYKQNQLTNDIK